ncbi:ROK family transcriptional regulator [bacterium]|nr:ROK family transcriptional regulator [bacterium]
MIKQPFQLKIPSHREILNAIRINGEISGAELSRMCKYQPSTIVYILRSLQSKGLIEIARISSSLGSAGKPPTLWRLVPDKGYIVGIELIPNALRSTVINFGGEIVHREQRIGIGEMNPEKVPQLIHDFIVDLLAKLKIPIEKVIGVGVALPGLVDRTQGVVLYSRRIFLKNFPLQKMLINSLSLPVEIVNDANAGALGIRWYQNTPDEPIPANLVFLTLNERQGQMGAGLILDYKLYEGADGSAGEILKSMSPLEDLIEEGRVRFGGDAPILNMDKNEVDLSIEDIVACARKQCNISKRILNEFARFIVDEICKVVEFINPDRIVVGGDITEASDLLLDKIRDTVKQRLLETYPIGMPSPDITFSEFGIYSVSMGATALILRKIFR